MKYNAYGTHLMCMPVDLCSKATHAPCKQLLDTWQIHVRNSGHFALFITENLITRKERLCLYWLLLSHSAETAEGWWPSAPAEQQLDMCYRAVSILEMEDSIRKPTGILFYSQARVGRQQYFPDLNSVSREMGEIRHARESQPPKHTLSACHAKDWHRTTDCWFPNFHMMTVKGKDVDTNFICR